MHATVAESVASARAVHGAVVEGGATMLARAKPLGSSAASLTKDLSKDLGAARLSDRLSLVGWSEANATGGGGGRRAAARSE